MNTKVSLALGGASVAGTTALGGYYYLSSDNASIQTSLKGYRLISNLSREARAKQWEEELESDFSQISKDIPDLKGVSDKAAGGKKLEAWCSKQMSLNSKENSETLALVKKYCLVRSISNQLSRKGISLLGDDEGQWKSTYGKRKSESSSRSDVNLEGEWQSATEEKDLPVIKSWCSSNRERDFIAADSSNLYQRVLLWCTADAVVIS
ncbi:hypothetical protein MHF_1311 [Mycoplasma haemofelis Ohio2]|uniref:Uncharacterized protein n=1 Tax=Mycoplasma haemofelis (strain Ohio2) TaxID=859194 RepID=F6FG49_MYCHI|nr:hypothetical protein MHF_1311 [Mycoplasma haemofelis Ohio2]